MSVLPRDLTRQVDQYIDEHHETFSQLGTALYETFDYDAKKKRVATQVRNLEQVVYSARRFADIEFFVKNQMGKSGNEKWLQVGDQILKQLAELRRAATELSSSEKEQFAVRLRLACGWVQAVVGQYLYEAAQRQIDWKPPASDPPA